ncbi:MAG: Single-stranded-DNA-specific exonuclease RecJ [Planctomycetota bacterium]
MGRKWTFHPHDAAAVRRLSGQLSVSPLVAQVLIARGRGEPDAARKFLDARLSDLHDPALLPGIDTAADAVVRAVQAGRRITIYGDYDVDGVTGTSLLWHCLQLCGAQVDYYIPCRMEEGYGLNETAIRQLHEEDPGRLLISVDCGIASVSEATLARELGLELIITDHHQFGAELPNAAALVHPRLPGSEYPFGELCGAGVAFKLAWAVCQRLGEGRRASPRMREFLKQAVSLAALGTVADVVPLHEENRILVRYGLQTLKQQSSIGMQALLRASGLMDKAELQADDIGFSLAPRINAAGRLGQARLAVELLTTDNTERAIALADYLNQLNENRKTVERRILKQAKELVEQNPAWEGHRTLVLAHHEWHPGVIGVVASRVAEHFSRPTVLIALREDGIGAGSGRSWAGFDLYNGLTACREHLLTFGGHRAAAGLKVKSGNVAAFRESLAAWAADHFHPTADDTQLRIDAEVMLSEVSLKSVQELARIGPFGHENPQPRFMCSHVQLAEPPRTMGEGGRHLAIRVRQHGTVIRGVCFGRGDWAEQLGKQTEPFSISFAPVINTFQGMTKVEIQLIDWKPAGEPMNVSVQHDAPE